MNPNEKHEYLLLGRDGRYLDLLFLTQSEAKAKRWHYVNEGKQLIKLGK